jgi:hypothetical protein
MEKVLSEKNKQIRLKQRFFERLRHRVRVFYPSAFVVDKHGIRVPYRRPETQSAGKNRMIDMKKTNELMNIWYPAPAAPNGTDAVVASDASAPQAVEVGTIGHGRSVLKDA